MIKKTKNTLILGITSLLIMGCGPKKGSFISSFNPWGDVSFGELSSTSSSNSDSKNEIERVHGEFNGTVKIHYFKADLNYDMWDLWLWPYGGGDGGKFDFNGEETIYDKTWKTLTLDITKPISDVCGNWTGCMDSSKYTTVDFGGLNQTKIGIIPRRAPIGQEPQKDGDDRFIDLSQTDENGNVNVYVLYNNKSLFYYEDQVEEFVTNKIDIATVTDVNKIHVVGLDALPESVDSYKIVNGNDEININSLSIYKTKDNDEIKKSGDLVLNKELDLTKEVKIYISGLGNNVVTLDGFYDNPYFIENYTTNEKLGPIYTKEYTTFKVWSPYATQIKLNLYRYGDSSGVDSEGNVMHPADPTPYLTKYLSKGEKGVWSYKHPTNCDGIYYTYTIMINGYEFENVIDPYAPTSGVNAERGMVIDMDKYNPEGWDQIEAPSLDSANEPIVYELHTRDLTSHKTWQGKNNSINRGKFLGLIEEGTTYTNEYGQTTKTGFDYIKDLGITHVQLLPLNDINSVDEMKLNNEEYNNKISGGSYSWGYDPKHYSSIEGAYSSNPFNGEVKVKELKEVSKKYNENGIGLILDVVYNHMSNTSTFNMLVPGYYFRTQNYGQIVTNYSGAGSDVATEREMMKNFICQNLTTLTEEYKFAGYRFDLMGLIAKDTMQAALESVQKVDPDTVLYGEAWTMDDNWDGNWNGHDLAVQWNLNSMGNKSETGFQGVVGAFNDGFRTAVKGEDNISDKGRGWIYGSGASYYGLRWALTGATGESKWYQDQDWQSISGTKTYSTKSAGASINYVECHDGSTLADKIAVTVGGSLRTRQKYTELATSLVMFSQGVSFIQAGQEMLRSKKVPVEWMNDENINSDHYSNGYFTNSYNYSDRINAINWELAITNSKTVSSIKDMISLKKDHRSIFSQKDTINIQNNYNFLNTGNSTLLAYEIKPDTTKLQDSWSKALVFQNSANNDVSYNLTGSWYIAYNDGIYTTNPQIINGKINIPSKGTVILYQK